MRGMHKIGLAAMLLGVAGCATVDTVSSHEHLDKKARWAMLPIVNHTETPQAGLRAEGLAESLLRSEGVQDVTSYPAGLSDDTLLEPSQRRGQEAALEWAKAQGMQYALTGSVEEWRYKVGVDGEPAVGVTLQVIEVGSGKVLWSGAASKTGWSRDGLSAVAQKLIRGLIVDAVH